MTADRQIDRQADRQTGRQICNFHDRDSVLQTENTAVTPYINPVLFSVDKGKVSVDNGEVVRGVTARPYVRT